MAHQVQAKPRLQKPFAKESGAVLIIMNHHFLAVAAIFSLAYKLQPAIIFIDEVDSFLGQCWSSDHEALTNMKTEFMALWDGFTTDLSDGKEEGKEHAQQWEDYWDDDVVNDDFSLQLKKEHFEMV